MLFKHHPDDTQEECLAKASGWLASFQIHSDRPGMHLDWGKACEWLDTDGWVHLHRVHMPNKDNLVGGSYEGETDDVKRYWFGLAWVNVCNWIYAHHDEKGLCSG